MANTYSMDWGSNHPGCMIILLDQSGSMAAPFGSTQVGKGQKKCDAVATVLNNFLNELITINTKVDNSGQAVVKPRADIAVIGYEGGTVASALGGPLAGKDFVTLQELQMNPINIEMRKVKEMDDTGKVVEIQVPFPVWANPKAGGGTPMLKALQRARDLARNWAASHPKNYPPVVVNVTDGMAGGDLLGAAREICQISTSDGQAVLYNVHITELRNPEVLFPSSETELPNDQFAKQLFAMSSVIPDASKARLESLLGRPVPPGARGMIFNGDAYAVTQMFNFASAPASQQLDPNL